MSEPSPVRSVAEIEKNEPRTTPESDSRAPDSSAGSTLTKKSTLSNIFRRIHWPQTLQWVPDNFTWPKLKPIIRSAIAAWLSTVLFLVPAVEKKILGQAGFLIVITAFMSPPSDSFIAVVEREFMILLFVSAAWGWSCLGIKLADLARVNRNAQATLLDAVTGQYLEVAPSVIFGVFIFLGSTIILYIRARSIPSQIFACLLACLCLDLSLTTAALFPFPFYQTGQAIVLPIAFHSAMAILTSIVIFPSSVSAQFTTQLALVIEPLAKAFELHQTALKKDPYSPQFFSAVDTISALVAKSEASLAPLGASARLLGRDLVYSRFPPPDFSELHSVAKRMAVRANGMTRYFTLLDSLKDKYSVTPVTSRVGTPVPGSPAVSRPPSPPRTPVHEKEESETDSPVTPTRRSRHPHHHHHAHHHSHRHHLYNSLLHLSLAPKKTEHAVGVFESHRFLDLETRLHHPEIEAHTKQTNQLLSESCTPLLKSCQVSVDWIQDWLRFVRRGWLARLIGGAKQQRALEQRMAELDAIRKDLSTVLDEFKNNKRHHVLRPWNPFLDSDIEVEKDMPPHRHLFHCYVYQYHLLQMATNVKTMLEAIHKMELEHKEMRLWTPAHSLLLDRHWHLFEINEDEEDPERIQGFPPNGEEDDLGMARRRDPDALPPRNWFEWIMRSIYRAFAELGRGNTLYAIKAAVLTVVLCVPLLLQSSAKFAYENRFVWAVFMGQSTLSRFRGDTLFGLSARVLSTFLGGVLGMVMWYISSGSGEGNAYGLAAVCAVTYPFFFYGRIYYAGPPMKVIIFFITAILVIGYSYQDAHIFAPGNPGVGWEVAWRRFLLVTAGVVAAGLFSLLPPSTTIRHYERRAMSTTVRHIGSLYCDIISYANLRNDMDPQEIVTGLIAIRSKILRSIALKSNAIYEFSMRGRWPARRYQKVMELQLELAYSLSHLFSVVEHMDPAWTRAFLRRTRLLDSDFQGDVLAVISMINTSLRTGCALPQITPCPLIDRFRGHLNLGPHVMNQDSEDDYGIPRTLTLETLQNEQYMKFCCGIATTYGIISRLDRLMVNVKEIVGEQYHIHGAGVSLPTRVASGIPLGSRTNTLDYRAPVV